MKWSSAGLLVAVRVSSVETVMETGLAAPLTIVGARFSQMYHCPPPILMFVEHKQDVIGYKLSFDSLPPP